MSNDDCIFDSIDLRLKSERMYQYIMGCLSQRERDILVMRYGLFCKKPLTQREVANKLGISRSYVSRIEKKAIGVLRKQFAKLGMDS